MEWGGGVIGWSANSSIFEEHFLSDKPNSNVIGCWYSNSYSAIVYRLDCKYKYMYSTVYACTYMYTEQDNLENIIYNFQ